MRLLARLVTSQLERSRRAAEREKAEAERRESEAERLRLAAIIETSDDAIYSMTRGGRITSWNRGAERLYGHDAAEMIGQSRSPSSSRPTSGPNWRRRWPPWGGARRACPWRRCA